MSEVSEWLNNDETYEVTDSSTVESVNKVAQDSGDEEMPAETVTTMTHTEGLAALDAAPRYVEQQAEVTQTDTMLLRQWRDIAAQNRGFILKQKTFDSFF